VAVRSLTSSLVISLRIFKSPPSKEPPRCYGESSSTLPCYPLHEYSRLRNAILLKSAYPLPSTRWTKGAELVLAEASPSLPRLPKIEQAPQLLRLFLPLLEALKGPRPARRPWVFGLPVHLLSLEARLKKIGDSAGLRCFFAESSSFFCSRPPAFRLEFRRNRVPSEGEVGARWSSRPNSGHFHTPRKVRDISGLISRPSSILPRRFFWSQLWKRRARFSRETPWILFLREGLSATGSRRIWFSLEQHFASFEPWWVRIPLSFIGLVAYGSSFSSLSEIENREGEASP